MSNLRPCSDVSRNLPDSRKPPLMGEEILEKPFNARLVVSQTTLQPTHFAAEYQNRADDSGAVVLTMFDDDAKGLIDLLERQTQKHGSYLLLLDRGCPV